MIIENDTFFIASRIKEIDSDYYIVYNQKNSKYEVHHTTQCYESLCLVLPYDRLDCRALELVARTRIENYDKIRAEIEQNNERLGGSYFAL